MNCTESRDMMSAYIDGALRPDRRAAFEGHLSGCATCRLELQDMQETVGMLRDMGSETPPPWLFERIMQRVKKEAAPKKSLWQRLFYPLHIKLPLEAMATVAIAVAAVLIFRSMGPELRPVVPKQGPGPLVQLQEEPAQKERAAPAIADRSRTAETLRPEKKEAASREAAKEPFNIPSEPYQGTSRMPATAAPPSPAPSPATTPAHAPSTASRADGSTADLAAKEESRDRETSGAAQVMRKAGKIAPESARSVTLLVSNPETALRKAEAFVVARGGRLLSANRSESSIEVRLALRPDDLSALRKELEQLGQFKDPWKIAPDVTELTIHLIRQQ